MEHKLHSRRAFLRGLGTLVALPWLESLPMAKAFGQKPPGAKQNLCMAFLLVPNGAHMADWTPKETGSNFVLPPTLKPLQDVQGDVLVLTGLAHDKARANGDGAGDHARASATFLTACQARKTAGADIRAGVSVDQIAARGRGRETRLPSLELGCDRGQMAGNCDSGYSCAYSFNISWRGESSPMPPEINPRLVFERLFTAGSGRDITEARIKRDTQRKSILDFVSADARRIQGNLSAADRRKLDEYLTSVREVELRLQNTGEEPASESQIAKPEGVPKDYSQHIRLQFDLLALAFQTDATRISTFMLAHEGSNRSYPFLSVPEGHHDLSHHGNDDEKQKKISRINQFHVEQLAYFLKKLKSVREGEQTLLDRCMIVYGSAISDGNRHNHDQLPILLAGGGGGTIKTGRHVRYDSELPMANLFVSLLDRFGTPVERIGDSTGPLSQLS